ncbi:MAG: DUF885 domain-containing protein, partial [Actinomycetota bacterium]|nr:DUF885 domain-containing protein [Actinomycetota bacterium]
MADDRLQELAEEYWEALLESSPTTATLLGDHRFDDRLEDLSETAEAAQRVRWTSILDRLGAIERADLSGEDVVTSGELEAELSDAVAAIDRRLVELQSDQMTGFHIGLIQSVPVMSAPDAGAATMLVERFRQIPRALDQAVARFLAGAATGRTPPAICVARSVNMIEGYLSSPLDADVFATVAGPPDWDGEAAWRA